MLDKVSNMKKSKYKGLQKDYCKIKKKYNEIIRKFNNFSI